MRITEAKYVQIKSPSGPESRHFTKVKSSPAQLPTPVEAIANYEVKFIVTLAIKGVQN